MKWKLAGRSLRLAALAALGIGAGATAQAPEDIRVALVIGDGAYAAPAALLNPAKDAAAMAANPFGRNGSGFPSQKGKTDLVKLAKGSHLKLRYGILLHQGNTQEGQVAEHYSHFAK